jgi:excisionase family DNA binding protein
MSRRILEKDEGTMLALLDQGDGPFVADEAEATIARVAAERLKAVAKAKQDIKIVVQDDAKIVVPLPARAVEMIVYMLNTMAERTPISIIPHEAELTTQQAADFLNVSRPFLTKLLDAGEINHRLVGRHRRVRFADLYEYARKSEEKQLRALADLHAEERRLKLE